MKEDNIDYAELGLRALKRAAAKAYENAKRYNLKIPIWEDGQVKYIEPEIKYEIKEKESEEAKIK